MLSGTEGHSWLIGLGRPVTDRLTGRHDQRWQRLGAAGTSGLDCDQIRGPDSPSSARHGFRRSQPERAGCGAGATPDQGAGAGPSPRAYEARSSEVASVVTLLGSASVVILLGVAAPITLDSVTYRAARRLSGNCQPGDHPHDRARLSPTTGRRRGRCAVVHRWVSLGPYHKWLLALRPYRINARPDHWEASCPPASHDRRVSAGALDRQQPGSGAWPWCPAPDQPGDSATAFTQHEDNPQRQSSRDTEG